MGENLINKSLSPIDIGSPDLNKGKRQKKNVDTPLKEKKPNKESPKNTYNVKRQTINGDEYQRILQILIRHRSLQIPGVKIGSEVSKITDLDDIVYIKDKTCKFFQIKYSTSRRPSKAHLFKADFPQLESPPSPSRKKIKSEFHLALYFESFVHIRKNSQFKDYKIEDVYFVTNQSFSLPRNVKNNENYSNFLTEAKSLENDELLYLEGTTAEKYNLNVKAVKESSFYKFLKNQYKYIMKKEEDTNSTNMLERFEELINEFLTTIRIVMKYPEINTVRNKTMEEIFGKIDRYTRKIFQHYLIHMEIETLRNSNEYFTSEEWKSNIDWVENSIEKLKMIGITEYEKKRLSWKFDELRFNNDKLFEDLDTFLKKKDHRVLHLCKIHNVDLTVATVLNHPKLKNACSDYFIYCTLEGLVSSDGLLNSFLQRKFKLLVITCGNGNVNHDLKEIVRVIEKSFDESEKKYIFISQNEDIFKTYLGKYDYPMYYKKNYSNGFGALDERSKQKILEKVIIFQGQPTSLGLIFKNSKDFAKEVIDECCLWEIIDTNYPCTISNAEALSSLGYNKDYYISRNFLKEIKINKKVIHSKVNECGIENPYLGNEKTIILVGDSGEGKSTVLTHIANLIKQLQNEIWVIRVNLRIFFAKNKIDTLGDVTKKVNATEMAFKMAFSKQPNRLEELLFKKGLPGKKIKMVLMLDGFNEIDSDTQNKVCDFVKTIQLFDSILKCWITTQKQSKTILDNNLNKKNYYLLKPLSDKDQIDLLVKYWTVEYSKKSLPEHYNVSDLKKDASLALNIWKKCIFDDNERAFTSVALNLKMLADILLDRNRKLDQHISLLDLYNLFVKQKFFCYSRETSVNCNSCIKDDYLDSLKENLFVHSVRKVLQCISAKTVTSKIVDVNNKFPGMQTYDTFKDCVGDEYLKISLSKIGLLTLKTEEYELSHESYVQFFFSEFIVNYFSDEKVQCFLMDHVLVENSFQLCRRFIDELFSNHLENKTGESQRKNINQTELNDIAQDSFIKDTQLEVVIEERLLNIMQILSNKLSGKRCTTFLDRVVNYIITSLKFSLQSLARVQVISDDLESIEDNLRKCSVLEIIKLLEEPKLFNNEFYFDDYDDARQRVQTILKLSKTKPKESNFTTDYLDSD